MYEELFRRTQELQSRLTAGREQYYFNDILFSFQWWLLVAALIGSYALLWRLIDRTRLLPVLFVGLFVFCIAVTADSVGGSFLLWDYPGMAMPWGPRLITADLIIPVGYMLVYQKFRERKAFFVAILALSVLYAFVLEPLAVSAGIYEPLRWRYVYSFPIFAAIGILAKAAADGAERVQRRAAETARRHA